MKHEEIHNITEKLREIVMIMDRSESEISPSLQGQLHFDLRSDLTRQVYDDLTWNLWALLR